MPESPQPASVWQLKPWWCQPWSIVFTGMVLIGGSWLLVHRWWFTTALAIPVGTWMGFFVLLYPRLVKQAGLLEAEQSAQGRGLNSEN